LRRLAAQKLTQEKPGQTLQATALVHEAYLRLIGKGDDQPWNGRGHFFAAAEAMRRILVENARKRSLKRGDGSPGPTSRVRIGILTRGKPRSGKFGNLVKISFASTDSNGYFIS
jgi:ECF sigma factor